MINLQGKREDVRTFLQTKGRSTMTTMTEPIATLIELMLTEFREEAAITQRILERVPADKLAWKPHRKSMSLGQLALHIASVPGSVARISQLDEFDVAKANFDPPAPKNVEEICAAFQESVRAAEACLSGMSEPKAMGHCPDGKWIGDLQPAESRGSTIDYVEPLVPPPGPTVGLSSDARCCGAGDLWAQCGRESVWLTPPVVEEQKEPSGAKAFTDFTRFTRPWKGRSSPAKRQQGAARVRRNAQLSFFSQPLKPSLSH
jgi:hypothetical protein